MAFPTQITIASGKTVYEGDPENDQGITSRQVGVEVTYELERQDGDLLDVAAAKSKEVEAAHEAAWRQVRKEQTEMALPPTEATAREADEDDPGTPSCDGDCPDDETGDGSDGHDEVYGGRGMAPIGANGRVPACPSPGVVGPSERPVTKPQKLALQAQARRLGLSDQALADEIRDRFGKTSFTPRYAIERLTKTEGDTLLRALAAREWEAIRAARLGRVAEVMEA